MEPSPCGCDGHLEAEFEERISGGEEVFLTSLEEPERNLEAQYDTALVRNAEGDDVD